MMEAAYSLMQLAKTSVKLAQLAEAKLHSLCTDQQLAVPHLCHVGDINSRAGALVVLLDLGLLETQQKRFT
jgi:acetyl-CoA carboxylase carboxyl transferase subunit beta